MKVGFRTLLGLGALLLGCAGGEKSPAAESDRRPNILLIVADDLGYSDVGAYGSEIATPNIDALAAEGVLFTQFHVAPNCGPTRGSLLTGVDSHLAGLGGNSGVAADNQKASPAYQGFLRDDVVTMAELLRDGGYHTYMAGKWHLGHETRNLPGGRGFERSFALMNGAASHWADQIPIIPGSETHYTEDDQPVEALPEDFYSTTVYTDRIIEYINENIADDAPFFAYLSYTAAHNPLHAPDEYIEKYRGRYDAGWDALAAQRAERLRELDLLTESQPPHPRPDWVSGWDELTAEQRSGRSRDMEVYAGMIDYMDDSIGRLLKHLRDIEEYDETLIVFISDNGPSKTTILDYIAFGGEAAEFFEQFDNELDNRGRPGSSTDIGPGWAYAAASPLRLFKGYVAQGGIQVPGLVKLPGQMAAAGTSTNALVHVMDLMPTFLEVAEAEYPMSYRGTAVASLQGVSLIPLLRGDGVPGGREFGWEAYGMAAYRQGNWKALRLPPPYGNGKWQLYDLAVDPGELDDLAAEHPDRAAELAEAWERYADANEVILPSEPVAYARPVPPGKY